MTRTEVWYIEPTDNSESAVLERHFRSQSKRAGALLSNPLAAIVEVTQLRRGHELSQQVAKYFCQMLAHSTLIPIGVSLNSNGIAVRPLVSSRSSRRPLPASSDPISVLRLYLETVDNLFRSWALYMPNANAWSAQNGYLASMLEAAMENRTFVPEFCTDGVRAVSKISGARSLNQAAQWRACLLFWDYLRRPDRKDIRICANRRCESLFSGPSNKRYCGGNCGRNTSSNRAHHRDAVKENTEKIELALEILQRRPSPRQSGSWKTRIVGGMITSGGVITSRWITEIRKERSRIRSACPPQKLNQLLEKIREVEASEVSIATR